jgi:hypothetical protein
MRMLVMRFVAAALVLLASYLASGQTVLKPVWSIPYPLTGKTRIVAEVDAIYIASATRILCLNKADGSTRWDTALSPVEENSYSPPADIYLADDAVCLGRRLPEGLVDIVDRKTGTIRAVVRYRWRYLEGVLPVGRYAIVCTSTHNYPDQVSLSEIDLRTGRQSDQVSQFVAKSLWKPYYAFGGQLFRLSPGAGLAYVPLFSKPFDSLRKPKHLWFMPDGHAFVSNYDEHNYPGWGIDLSLWSLEPPRQLWSKPLPEPEAKERVTVAFTRDVIRQGDEIWFDASGQVYRYLPERFLNAKLWQVFQTRGQLFGVKLTSYRGSYQPTAIMRYQGNGSFSPYAELPPTDADFSRIYPLGETLLRHSWQGTGRKEPERLELFRFFREAGG